MYVIYNVYKFMFYSHKNNRKIMIIIYSALFKIHPAKSFTRAANQTQHKKISSERRVMGVV